MIVINESNWPNKRSRVQLYDIDKLAKQIKNSQPAFFAQSQQWKH